MKTAAVEAIHKFYLVLNDKIQRLFKFRRINLMENNEVVDGALNASEVVEAEKKETKKPAAKKDNNKKNNRKEKLLEKSTSKKESTAKKYEQKKKLDVTKRCLLNLMVNKLMRGIDCSKS